MFKAIMHVSAAMAALCGAAAAGPTTATTTAPTTAPTTSPLGGLPPGAVPGECYARVVRPAEYDAVPETIVVQEGFQRLHATEPSFKTSSMKIMTREPGIRYVVRQPRYEPRTETITVRAGYDRLEIVPAQFETVTETITIGEPRLLWRPGANLSSTQRIDPNTGQVYCLVEEPAQTKTVTKRVMVAPEQVRRVAVPAKTATVTKHVLVDAGGVDEAPIPAEYQTLHTEELVHPADTAAEHVPPQTRTMTRKILRSPERFDWIRVLCETNATPDTIRQLQSALKDRGYYLGPIDGVVGPMTQQALEAFQRDNGIAHAGYVTMDTLRALGVGAPWDHSLRHGYGHDRLAGGDPGAHAAAQPQHAKPVAMQRANVDHSARHVGGAGRLSPPSSPSFQSHAVGAADDDNGVREYSVRKQLNWRGK